MDKYEVLEKAGAFQSDLDRIKHIDNELGELEGRRVTVSYHLSELDFLKVQISAMEDKKKLIMIDEKIAYLEKERKIAELNSNIRIKQDRVSSDSRMYLARLEFIEKRMKELQGIRAIIVANMHTNVDTPTAGE